MATVFQRTGTTLEGSSHQQNHLGEVGSVTGWARNGSPDNPDVGDVNESDYQGTSYAVGLIDPLVMSNSQQLDEVENRFNELVDRWIQETGMLSSVAKKSMHPAYREIIEMGDLAIPLLLRELMDRPGHWTAALRAITGEDPVPPESAGQMRRMADAWLIWGTERGYILEVCSWNPTGNSDSQILSGTNTRLPAMRPPAITV